MSSIFLALLALSLVMSTVVSMSSPSKTTRVCKICKKTYDPLANEYGSCRHHRGYWSGAENSKHYGTRSGGENTGLSQYWDCCDGESFDAPGCMTGKHKSYDDDQDAMPSVFLNKDMNDQ